MNPAAPPLLFPICFIFYQQPARQNKKMATIPPRRRNRGLVRTPPGTTSISNPTKTLSATPPAPFPRVGATTTSLHGRIYLFAGGGGPSMTASFWVFEPAKKSWTLLSPADTTKPYPQPRSYRAITNDGDKVIYIHAECLAQGPLANSWSFDISIREWKVLAPAPGPSRGVSQVYYPYSLPIVSIGDGCCFHRIYGLGSEQKSVGKAMPTSSLAIPGLLYTSKHQKPDPGPNYVVWVPLWCVK